MANKNMTVVQQIFRSEITWIASIIAAIWFLVVTIVMPIQALQIGQTKIQEQLAIESKRYIDSEDRINVLEKNQAVVMSILQIKGSKN